MSIAADVMKRQLTAKEQLAMAKRIILHIGVQKSGTTYLQQMLAERHTELATAGVLFPLPEDRRSAWENDHELATHAIVGTEYPWVGEKRAAKQLDWARHMCQQVVEWPDTAVVSAEALSVVRTDAAKHIIAELGNETATEVIITGRSLGKMLPSKWQQHLRNGNTRGQDAYLAALAQERETGWDAIEQAATATAWRALGLGHLATRWASIVGKDRVTFVVNPGSPSDALWHRFLEATGLDDLDVDAPTPSTTVHTGITAAEAEVLRASNARLQEDGWRRGYVKRINRSLIPAMSARHERGPRLGVGSSFRQRVANWNEENIADLDKSGVRIIGDLEELTYDPKSEPAPPTATQVAAAAGTAIHASFRMGKDAAGPAETS